MNSSIKLPFYVKITAVLLAFCLLVLILYIGSSVFTPILMALLFSILVRPINRFLKHKLRFPNVLACLVTITLFVIVILGIVTFISWQISGFSEDWETIEKNITIHLANLQEFLKNTFGFDEHQQNSMISSATNQSKSSITNYAASFLISLSDTIFNMVTIPIYMFLMLLYQNHFITFLSRLVGDGDQESLKQILFQIKTAVQSYLIGVCIQIISIAAMTTIGLTIVGVEHALLLGVITGILGLIPYLGNIIACLISIMATLTGSPDLSLIVGVLIVTVVVQIIDNNILVPLVVSSKVEINAFVSIIGILVGGMIAGIAGMFLAIPILAILKVIFDNVKGMEPWGYFLGDDLPKIPLWYKKVPYLANRNNPYEVPFVAPIPDPDQVKPKTTNDPEEIND